MAVFKCKCTEGTQNIEQVTNNSLILELILFYKVSMNYTALFKRN